MSRSADEKRIEKLAARLFIKEYRRRPGNDDEPTNSELYARAELAFKAAEAFEDALSERRRVRWAAQ
jgi:hypothetical protein